MTPTNDVVIGFNPDDHTYTLDGRPVPAVSKILEAAYDFRFVKPEALERARDLGTKVHKTIELFEAGTLKRKSLHPVLDNHLTQWERFKEDFRFVPLQHEVQVASKKYSYAGTFDTQGLFLPTEQEPSEVDALLDLKTGQEYAPHKLQTAAYLKAAVEMGLLPDSTKRASLYLSESDYMLRWHSNPIDTAAFLSLATFHHWRQHHGK